MSTMPNAPVPSHHVALTALMAEREALRTRLAEAERNIGNAKAQALAWRRSASRTDNHYGSTMLMLLPDLPVPPMATEPVRVYDLSQDDDLVDLLVKHLQPIVDAVAPFCDSHNRDAVESDGDGVEFCNDCAADGFSGELGSLAADALVFEVLAIVQKRVPFILQHAGVKASP